MDKKEFKRKFPIKNFSYCMIKFVLKDLYTSRTNKSEEEFVKDFVSLDKKDRMDIQKEYLTDSIVSFFEECSIDTLKDFVKFTNEQTKNNNIKYKSKDLDIGDDFASNTDIDEMDITEKYSKKVFGLTFIKGIMNEETILGRLNKNDDIRLDYNRDDLMFLKDLNMIGNDDNELRTLETEYLTAGIYNYFTEAAVSADKDIRYFINRDEEKFIDDDIDEIEGVTVKVKTEEEKDDLFNLF